MHTVKLSKKNLLDKLFDNKHTKKENLDKNFDELLKLFSTKTNIHKNPVYNHLAKSTTAVKSKNGIVNIPKLFFQNNAKITVEKDVGNILKSKKIKHAILVLHDNKKQNKKKSLVKIVKTKVNNHKKKITPKTEDKSLYLRTFSKGLKNSNIAILHKNKKSKQNLIYITFDSLLHKRETNIKENIKKQNNTKNIPTSNLQNQFEKNIKKKIPVVKKVLGKNTDTFVKSSDDSKEININKTKKLNIHYVHSEKKKILKSSKSTHKKIEKFTLNTVVNKEEKHTHTLNITVNYQNLTVNNITHKNRFDDYKSVNTNPSKNKTVKVFLPSDKINTKQPPTKKIVRNVYKKKITFSSYVETIIKMPKKENLYKLANKIKERKETNLQIQLSNSENIGNIKDTKQLILQDRNTISKNNDKIKKLKLLKKVKKIHIDKINTTKNKKHFSKETKVEEKKEFYTESQPNNTQLTTILQSNIQKEIKKVYKIEDNTDFSDFGSNYKSDIDFNEFENSFETSKADQLKQIERVENVKNNSRNFLTVKLNIKDILLRASLINKRLNLSIALQNANNISSIRSEIENIIKDSGFKDYKLDIKLKNGKNIFSKKERNREINVKV